MAMAPTKILTCVVPEEASGHTVSREQHIPQRSPQQTALPTASKPPLLQIEVGTQMVHDATPARCFRRGFQAATCIDIKRCGVTAGG